MSEPQEDVRITLRLPRELREWLLEWAAGDRRRPPASLNSTILFVLEAGRGVLESEIESGHLSPELIAA